MQIEKPLAMITRGIILSTFVLMLVPSPGVAQPHRQGFENLLDDYDPRARIAEVATSFFKVPGGVEVELTNDVERFIEGMHLQAWSARRKAGPEGPGEAVGTLLRVQVHADSASRFDLALRIDEGKIEAVAAVRDVLVDGQPMPEIVGFIETLRDLPVSQVSTGLAAFFDALHHIGEATPPKEPDPHAPKSWESPSLPHRDPGSLVRVAFDFFHLPPGRLPLIETRHAFFDHEKGVEATFHEVMDSAGRRLGGFHRLRVNTGRGPQIDLAFRLEGGIMKQVEMIQPFFIHDRPVLDLPERLEKLAPQPISAWARPLALLIRSLTFGETVLEKEGPGPIDLETAANIYLWMQSSRPAPADRVAMPEFEAHDEAGDRVTSRELAGGVTIVFFTEIHTLMARQIMAWTHEWYTRRSKTDRMHLLDVTVCSSGILERYRERGGSFPATVIPDPGLELHDLFGVAFTPCIHVYGPDRKLVKFLTGPWKGREALQSALDETLSRR